MLQKHETKTASGERIYLRLFSKSDADVENISVNDVLQLSDNFVSVVESFYTVSGAVYVVLACGAGLLEIGTMLISVSEKKWVIIKNELPIGRQGDAKLQKQVADNFWFLYKLQPIDHNEKPESGSVHREITPFSQ